jgi:hypothetical protein
MKKFYKNCSYIFKVDKNIQAGKPTIRKIRNAGNGSYTITLPPKIVSDITDNLNTDKIQISIRTGEELLQELYKNRELEDQFIIIKPYTENNDNKENVS